MCHDYNSAGWESKALRRSGAAGMLYDVDKRHNRSIDLQVYLFWQNVYREHFSEHDHSRFM